MAVFFFHTDILLNAFSVVKRRWQAPHPRCFLSRIGNAAAAAAAACPPAARAASVRLKPRGDAHAGVHSSAVRRFKCVGWTPLSVEPVICLFRSKMGIDERPLPKPPLVKFAAVVTTAAFAGCRFVPHCLCLSLLLKIF